MDYGDDRMNREISRARRNALMRESLKFFETMTSATPEGWPNIPADSFLSVLADVSNQTLFSRPDGWGLHVQLISRLKGESDAEGLQNEISIHHKENPRAVISNTVAQALKKEIKKFLSTLLKEDGVTRAVDGSEWIQMIADAVRFYGARRGQSDTYCQTFLHYIADGVEPQVSH